MVGADPTHLVAAAVDAGDFVIRQNLGAIGFGRARGTPCHLPPVHGTVLDDERTRDSRIQPGFVAQRLSDGDLLDGYLRRDRAGQEAVREFRVVALRVVPAESDSPQIARGAQRLPQPFTAPEVVFMIRRWKMKKTMATGTVMSAAAASLSGYCVPCDN